MSSASASAPPPPKRPRLNTDLTTRGAVVAPISSSSSSTRPPKRKRLAPVVKQKVHPGTAPILPDDVVGAMLGQACGLILKSYGFDGATNMALERMRRHAEDFFHTMIHECMTFARSQRRSRPTIIDFAHFLDRSGITPGSCEAEIDRYRKATNTTTKPSHVFELPPPPREPSPEPDLRLLFGTDLLPPPNGRRNKDPRRDYSEDFFPTLPSKHTYMSTPVYVERPTDPKEIREMATEESRVAGETLRKLLAKLSKSGSSGSGSKVEEDSKKLTDERAMALAMGRGDSRRRARDAAWQAAFDELCAVKNKKKKTSQDGNGVSPGILIGDDIMADDDGEGDASGQSEAERRWWMDGIVNSEKDYFRKGTMSRVLKTPIVLV